MTTALEPPPTPSLRRRIPAWLWPALAAGLLAALAVLSRDPRTKVRVVGAGALDVVREQDAPAHARYLVATRAREPVAQTAARVERTVAGWPDVIVLGLDGGELGGDERAERIARETLARLTRSAENAVAVPVVTSTSAPADAPAATRAAVARVNDWWRTRLCREPGLRLCVDLTPYSGDPAGVRRAVAAGVVDALGRREVIRASTQVGR